MKNLDALVAELKNSKYDILNRVSSSNGTAWLTLNQPCNRMENPEVVFNMVTLEDGMQVHLSILCSKEYGFESVASESALLGKRVGSMNLSVVTKQLPEVYLNKKAAENYLSENPDMLISKLSNVLNTQSRTIAEQSRTISNLDWYISCIYTQANKSVKKLFGLYKKILTGEGWMPSLEKEMEEEK